MLNARVCAKGGIKGRIMRHLRRFGRDEDGSMIIFSLFIFLLMLMIGGMAVDLMRFETNRSRLQATLDRAVLAAADLDQMMDPESVVRDYFNKAGLLDQLASVTVVQTFNSRSVSAVAAIEVDMMFMGMLGIEMLEAPAAGMAREIVTDIEIALVLDVSGSMRDFNKIGNLRAAASEFVATVLAGDVNNKISVSIVPFNAQVNIGAPLRARYNVTDLNGITNSNCIDLLPAVFAGPGISPTLAMPQSGYFDSRSSTTRNSNYYAPQTPYVPTAPAAYHDAAPTCKTLPNNIVRLPSNNIGILQNQINALTADGNTSITLGMKWGMALLDPGSQGIYTNLIGSGNISANYAGRPFAYNRPNTLKVVVVMTDGDHVPSYLLNAAYRSGNSPIYKATDGRFSIQFALPLASPATSPPAGYPFYVPHLSQWHWRVWNGSTPPAVPPACANNNDLASDPDGKGICIRTASGATVQTWPEVWSQLRMSWVGWQLYARGMSSNSTTRTTLYNNAMAAFSSNSISPAAMDTQLQATCQQARANGVVVFGIAFLAPVNGEAQIAGCSSSTSHYYEVNDANTGLGDAFRSIAGQINALRLVQ